jgi:polyphosphate kinase 2 (PPK2 family)
VYFGGWIRDTLQALFDPRGGVATLESAIRHVRAFESTLIAEGAIILKFYLHLPGRELRRRRRACRKGDFDDGLYRKRDVRLHRLHAAHRDDIAHLLHETSLPQAAWQVLDSSDAKRRDCTIGLALLDAINSRTTAPRHSAPPAAKPAAAPISAAAVALPQPSPTGPLATVDLSQQLDSEAYEHELEILQARLTRLTGKAARKGRTTVLVFEGWDAAGKGGVVRRLTAAIDASHYRVHPIAAPSEEERRYHYLWRFWRVLPPAGIVCVFDRSWYGRVLVERVEEFATCEAWQRAFDEINDFESQMIEHGYAFAKFWLHVSPDEQLRRFQERQSTPHKQFKIGAEDWRNREKWPQYEAAVNDMVQRTSPPGAAWRLIPANDKNFARIAVLRQVCEQIEAVL